MKKVLFSIAAFMAANLGLYAEQPEQPIDSLKQVKLNEVVVSSIRVGANAPVAFSNLNEKQIKHDNAAKNIPSLLQTLPSVVSYTEGGTGIGNSSFRIRGTDANRINITLNGMPLNNPESQEVFWVNIPDLSSSLKSMQIQRGVGTASNGAASFGASISLETTGSRSEAYGEASTAIGSYNAFTSSIAAGTGIMKSGFSLDGRYSKTTGDGYIRNGKVDHKTGYVSLAHYTDDQLIRLVYLNAIQHTGITWNGVSPDKMKEDRRYNSAGEYYDEANNVHYYDNETDNYYSNIAQLIYSRHLGDNLTLNANLSYNNGYGYYENYKEDQKFGSKFGLPDQVVGGVTYTKSDVIRRKLLSNNLLAGNASLTYKTGKLNVSAGGMYSYFDGSHYGQLPWVMHNENISPDYKWYVEEGTKRDMNGFVKADYALLEGLDVYGEIQYRYVDYRLRGDDDEMIDISQNNYYTFFNPKAGASYRFKEGSEVYASFGISNREPLRADLKDARKNGAATKVRSERLYDYELGYRYRRSDLSVGVNLYYMDYKDQLVQTGKLSDSGYKLQQNVPDSYRMGMEVEAAWTPLKWLRVDANATISRNKIKNYTAYYDVYTTIIDKYPSRQEAVTMKSTDISYSPKLVGAGILTVMPMKDLSFSLVNKYVGKMYYDNTSNKNQQLDDYFLSDFVASYTFDTHKIGKIDLQIFVYNVWDKKYVANAITYGTYLYDDGNAPYHDNYLFPQAPCNIMARVGIRF
ncbi:TonB-dependent receptor [Dysgonomonas sp. 25]|uniref:TonB-dependent receptor n=1 Tax=Dysgonomonas sp. 25 TaxID=2302933 RepID=UPI0013D22F72|nr:TonB-dependent receptor [Dysgonomonas sp. 25]NDV67807.1 TonB-dependent receptor [Dysgonomonas sp. 25]